MSLSILNNIPSLAAQNQLSITGMNLQKTLEALSSGSRINSGADDAAGLAIADGLDANVTALTQSARNATDGVGMLQVADGTLSQITTLLNRAVTLATESATGTVSDSQRSALDAEFQSIKAEIDNIGTKTTYNGSAIFAGGSTNNNQVTTSVTNAAGLASAVSGKITINYGSSKTLVFDSSTDGTTVQSVLDKVNNSGTGLIASLDKTGNIVVTDTQGRENATTPLSVTVDGTAGFKVNGDSSDEAFAVTNTASSLNVYLSDSTTGGSTSINVDLGALDSGKLNGVSLSNNDLTSASNAQTALTSINAAIASVAALRGNLGASSNQLTAASNVMNNQIQNLTAAESGIRSADIGSEVANMTKYNILQQTGMAALQQSNQMQQSVLKLLQ